MPASDICAAWTFGSIRSDMEKGMKPMPIEGSAQQAQAMSWWGSLSLAMKITIGAIASTVLILAIVLPIVIVIGNANDDEATSNSPLTFRQLAYVCNSGSPSYSAFRGVSGSTYHIKPAWEGTIYTYDADGSGSGSCQTEFTTYTSTWAPITQNTSDVPVMPSGISATPTLWQGPEGYYYLRINGCIAYYKESDNANAYWNGVSATWPVVEPDGSVQTAAPTCA